MADLRPGQRRRFRHHDFEPLTMTWAEVADVVFRRAESWLRDHVPPDFPHPDPIYGLFAREAVEGWVRRRWGLVEGVTGPEDVAAVLAERTRAMKGASDAKRAGTLPRRPPA